MNPVLLPRITFGKHRGKGWKDVPLDYLDWLIAQRDLNPDVRFTAQHHRRNRISRAARGWEGQADDERINIGGF